MNLWWRMAFVYTGHRETSCVGRTRHDTPSNSQHSREGERAGQFVWGVLWLSSALGNCLSSSESCYCTHWLFIHLITRRFLWARDTRRHRASSPSAQPGAQTMPLLPLRIEVRPTQERSSATGAGVANPISLVTSCPKLDVTVPTKARVEASSNICTTCACVCARVSLRAHVWCESKVRATHARTRPATCPRQDRRPPASSSQPPE